MTINIRFICGCEYKTTKIEEAVKHSDSTKHQMEIIGNIKPNEKLRL